MLQAGSIIQVGYSGVSFFFVLSGFILCYTYLRREVRARNFWLARAARILPVYIFGLIVSAPFAVHACRKAGVSFFDAAVLSPILMQAWNPKAALVWNSPGWSLSCEAFFYLIFPFIVWPLSTIFRRNYEVLFITVYLLSISFSLSYALTRPEGVVDIGSHATLLSIVKFNPMVRLPEFIFGIGLGTLYLDGWRVPKPGFIAVVSIGALILFLTLVRGVPYPALHNGLLAPLYGMLILSIASCPNMLSNPLLVLLGESSYSLYLLHFPAHQYFYWLIKRVGWSNWDAIAVAYLVIVVLLSIASYKLIEVPGRALIRSQLLSKLSPERI
jgi:peptidoglycan/LPS O-acetylase OafA/YrhL